MKWNVKREVETYAKETDFGYFAAGKRQDISMKEMLDILEDNV